MNKDESTARQSSITASRCMKAERGSTDAVVTSALCFFYCCAISSFAFWKPRRKLRVCVVSLNCGRCLDASRCHIYVSDRHTKVRGLSILHVVDSAVIKMHALSEARWKSFSTRTELLCLQFVQTGHRRAIRITTRRTCSLSPR